MTKSRGLREHHGKVKTPTYQSWLSMRARCTNPKLPAFSNYGGRGITICDRWAKFSNFLEDMGERPAGSMLERMDNAEGYRPDNCRWASRKEQNNNKRDNFLVTLDGETHPLAYWVERSGLKYATVHQRIRKGWTPEQALRTPLVTKRAGIPKGERIGTWGAENGVVFHDQQERAA